MGTPADVLQQLLELPFDELEDTTLTAELAVLAEKAPTARAFLLTYLVSRGRFVEALSEHRRLEQAATDAGVATSAETEVRAPRGCCAGGRLSSAHKNGHLIRNDREM